MTILEIAGIAVACLVLIGFLAVLVMLRDDGDGEMTIPPDIGSINEPKP